MDSFVVCEGSTAAIAVLFVVAPGKRRLHQTLVVNFVLSRRPYQVKTAALTDLDERLRMDSQVGVRLHVQHLTPWHLQDKAVAVR